MNNLDHVKNFYPDNYKLDLSETMKAALSKSSNAVGMGGSSAGGVGSSSNAGAMGAPHAELPPQANPGLPGVGYVTEKLYMLLQLYLQNKGWNPSAELLQCFTDLKDNAMLPSAAYLQVMANRLALDAQGRLILRENGKIVLPFEHFANAVMLKHMSGPHGLHLSVDATVRAVIESYTIGREQFGMEKEFIIEVVQSCPSPACRYYKNHMGLSPLPFMEQQFPGVSTSDFLQHLPHLPPPSHPISGAGAVPTVSAAGSNSAATNNNISAANNSAISVGSVSSSTGPGSVGVGVGVGVGNSGEVDLSKSAQAKVPPQLQHLTKQQQNSIQSQLSQISAAAAAAHHQQQLQQQQQQQAAVAKHQQQLTAAIIQQQNRLLAQQSLEKFSNLSTLEKQRVLAQLDPKHFDPMAVAAAAANLQIYNSSTSSSAPAATNVVAATPQISNSNVSSTSSNHHSHQLPPPSQSPHSSSSSSSHSSVVDQFAQKSVESLRSNLDSLESNKDLLALHNGAWGTAGNDPNRVGGTSMTNANSTANATSSSNSGVGATVANSTNDVMPMGQDKIVRIFAELMRNMARMKTYVRPSMCKPYGKQSESLQKTLMDTIQIVQTLRNCLPAPHIPVTSWKSESEGGIVGQPGNGGGPVLATAAATAAALQAGRVDNLGN